MKPRTPEVRLSKIPGAEIFPLQIPGHNRICNPSIAASDRGFFCIIREVNYDLNDKGMLPGLPPGGLQSQDWLARLDSDLKIIELQRIDVSNLNIKRPERIEDSRLLWWKGAWWLSATWVIGDLPSFCEMTLCRLEGTRVVEQHLLHSPTQTAMDKNWMPRVSGESLEWVYWIDPTEILTYTGAGSMSRRMINRYCRLENWRGSSQLVRYGNHWICVIHLASREVVTRYLHRLVELDDDFKIRRMSFIFTFEGQAVEFCAGLCLTETHAILSYGVHDREAHLMRLERSALEAMLRPLYVPRWLSVFFADARPATRLWLRQPRKKLVAWLAAIGAILMKPPEAG